MKTEVSSVDVSVIVKELKDKLIGARVEKVYQTAENEILIRLYQVGLGTIDLVIEASKRLHITQYPRPAPITPTNFSMGLRKYLDNARLIDITQFDFDRIVELKFSREAEYILINELFSRGNIVLTTSDYSIIQSLKIQRFKDRTIHPGEKYRYPPSKLNPLEITLEGLSSLFKASKTDLVRCLATQFNIGGLYAEEICANASIDKNKLTQELTPNEIRIVYQAIQKTFEPLKSKQFMPTIVLENEKFLDVVPFELTRYTGFTKRQFDNFNQALDEFFSSTEVLRLEKLKEQKLAEKIADIERRLAKQQKSLEQFKTREFEFQEMGDLIYNNKVQIENLLAWLGEAKKKLSWDEILKQIKTLPQANIIKEVKPKQGLLLLKLQSLDRAKVVEVDIDFRKKLSENAQEFYKKAKKQREKVLGAQKAVEATLREISKLREMGLTAIEIEKAIPTKRVKRKVQWFERLRWFISSDGFLVIGGRGAPSNEEVVKKYMQPEDLFLHSDAHGAPVVVIKTEGKPVQEQTIKEAAEFAAAYASTWKHRIFSADVYWVKPEQVSKTPPPGEYLPRGAFMIRGTRNYIRNIELSLAIGIKIDNEAKIIAGPVEPIQKLAKYWVTLKPGRIDRAQLAKQLLGTFLQIASDADKALIHQFITADDLLRALPPGSSEISK
ncbi:MAG: NFACT family protein [Euryarchaeota archaeon]|nr:NFACT family protein [Euryarchaeota archaeon]